MNEADRLAMEAALIKEQDKPKRSWKRLGEIDLNTLDIEVIPCGMPSLDKLAFLKRDEPELVVIGGRPSHGKSAFMFQIARYIAHSMPIYVFSIEMNFKSIIRRMLHGVIKAGVKTEAFRVQNSLEFKSFKDLPYFVDERTNLRASDIVETSRIAKEELGIQVIFIDFLNNIKEESSYNKASAIGNITRELKGLARELGIPIVLAAQLNRNCETRGNYGGSYRPNLSDLKDSSNIEQDADIVLFIHREAQITKDETKKLDAELIIAKNRNGKTGLVMADFLADKTQFIDRNLEI